MFQEGDDELPMTQSQIEIQNMEQKIENSAKEQIFPRICDS